MGDGGRQSPRSMISSVDLADKDSGGSGVKAIVNETIRALDLSLNDSTIQDDELTSWMKYPLDDSLDRNYCSDFFGDLAIPNKQFLRGFYSQQFPKESKNLHVGVQSSTRCIVTPNLVLAGTAGDLDYGVVNRAASAPAALALGAERAAGLVLQAGAEAFNKVRTSICDDAFQEVSTSLQSPKALVVSAFGSPAHSAGGLNFSHDPCPVAETNSNLRVVGTATEPINIEQARQHYKKHGGEVFVSRESSLAESTTTVLSGLCSSKDVNLQNLRTEVNQCVNAQGVWQLPSSSLPWHQTEGTKREQVEFKNRFNATVSGSAVPSTENGIEMMEGPERTVASPSRFSGNSTEKSGKGGVTSSKKKTSGEDDSGYQSEYVEGLTCNLKKLASGRSGTSKRSRAAEVHNQSERRRRDRINEKMRALQELIPNANKTDKASMLDEAIEYLKMLQSQVQMMSTRTGICFPHLAIPAGVHHIPCLPHMGVEIGTSMGLGMMDATSAARAVIPLSSMPGQAPPGHAPADAMGCQPSITVANTNEPQRCLQLSGLHSPGVMESYNPLLAHQQLQPVQLNMNMHTDRDMYHGFIQQQQLQQQQILSQTPQGDSGSKFIQ